jgi:AraC-like DNA-binding protein
VPPTSETDDEAASPALEDAPRVDLHLASAPGFDAFEPWRSSLDQLFDATLPGERPNHFRGDVTGFHLGESLVFNNASVAQTLSRNRWRIQRSGIDHVMIQYQTKGRLRGDYDGRSVEIGPGDIGFVDFARASTSADTDFSRITMIVPRARLPASFRDRNLHGVVLDGKRPATRLLGQYLAALFQTAGQLTPPEAAAAMDAAFVLAEGAWNARRELGPDPQNATSRTLRQLALALIDRRLAQPDLAPEPIAAALCISRSTLYGLFAADDGVMNVVLARRLDRCFDVIVDIRNRATISDIAFAHGFRSEAHFSRAFHKRFGVTATEARRLAALRPAQTSPHDENPSADAILAEWVRKLGRG